MPKTAVLYCVDSVAERAGTEGYAAELIERLCRSRFETHLACIEDSSRLRDLSARHATAVFPVGSMFRWNGLRQIRRLRRYIDDHGIDVVHTWMPKATVLGALAAKGSRCRVVISGRRNMGYWHTSFYLRLFRYLNRHTTRLLANSESVKQYTIRAEGVAPEKVDVLYNGVDLDRYAPSHPGHAAPASLIGVVANYRPVKRLDLFLRAASLVSAKVPSAEFLLVGLGPLRDELSELARALGLGGKVQFTDGQGSVPDYLRRMAIGCLTSESEGFSNAILEYMAAGLPVVATGVGGNVEAVEDGVNGYLVHEPSPESIAARLIELLQNEERRVEMGRRSLERCRRDFNIVDAVARQERYYLNLVAGATV